MKSRPERGSAAAIAKLRSSTAVRHRPQGLLPQRAAEMHLSGMGAEPLTPQPGSQGRGGESPVTGRRPQKDCHSGEWGLGTIHRGSWLPLFKNPKFSD